jgi:hypothetical protein
MMSTAAASDLEPAVEPGPARVPPSSAAHLALRVGLVLVLGLGLGHALHQPVERSVGLLTHALANGRVDTLTIERPPYDVTGSLEVRWTGDGRPATTRYEVDAGTGTDQSLEILEAVAASPRDVDVERVPDLPAGSSPLWAVGLALGAVVALLGMLVAGPEPRVATRWAWFWLGAYAWPLALVYLVVEPTCLWDRRTLVRQRRFTGGWSFLLSALLLGPLVMNLVHGT